MTLSSLGEKIAVIARIFDCWHAKTTRPLKDGKIFYQSCIACGARRRFDPKTLRSYGNFYYPAAKIGD